jgi:hypothetical protein
MTTHNIKSWTHIKIESKSRGNMGPAKNNKAEGSYCDVCPEIYLRGNTKSWMANADMNMTK